MAFNFWEAQRAAKSRTTLYVSVFVLLTLAVSALSDMAFRTLAPESYDSPYPLFGLGVLGVTFAVAAFQYLQFQAQGGGLVAQSMGGQRITKNSGDFKAQQLYNIVEEMAVASRLPMPEVYILPAKEINAFAAGLTPDRAAVAITYGALELLNRDEVQGVIGHEFGHIYNGDMKISMRLAAMLMGFFFILTIGMRMLRYGAWVSPRHRDDNKGGGNPLVIAALIMMAAGVLTWFFGSILRATVSRQREFLADACAVQFTRNADGIASALKKIGKYNEVRADDMPKAAMAYTHLYFDNRSFLGSLFATHPPLGQRIAAIEGRKYFPEEWK